MTEAVEVETWVAPVVKLNAVYLTNNNIELVAKWLRADYTHVQTDLRSRKRRVEFYREREGTPSDLRRPGAMITAAFVGEYIVRQDAHVDRYGAVQTDYYYSLSEEEMQTFRKESKE